jgi:hypothetical protein
MKKKIVLHATYGLSWTERHDQVLFHNQEVPGSNLSLETSYPEVFMVFLSLSRQMPV